MSILNSNSLLNLKARYGISIATTDSTSIYLSARKLERKLKTSLEPFFKYEIDLNIFVDRILDKIHDVSLCDAVSNYIDTITPKELYNEASKIKSFMLKMKSLAVKEKDDRLDDSDDFALDDDHLNYI